jgi:hypothetical protein
LIFGTINSTLARLPVGKRTMDMPDQSSDSHTLIVYQSKIAAAAARRNTTEAWRADAGLQLLQLLVWQAL